MRKPNNFWKQFVTVLNVTGATKNGGKSNEKEWEHEHGERDAFCDDVMVSGESKEIETGFA